MKQRKAIFIERLMREAREGRVDFDIYDFLLEFNKRLGDYYTTSSCSGRICVVEARRFSFSKGRGGFRFVEKWHRPVTIGEVLNVLKKVEGDNVWLIARAPILHVVARDVEKALRLMDIARRAGFKRACIFSIGDKGVVIEIQGEDRIDIPVIIDGVWVLTREGLGKAVELVNEALMFGKFRLASFIRLVEVELMGREGLGEMPRFYFEIGYRDFLSRLNEEVEKALASII